MIGKKTFLQTFCLIGAGFLLSACASSAPTKTPPQVVDSRTMVGTGGKYKVGQPYQIDGNWYYPREDYSYDETGIASWYGTEYRGVARTANGEIFNKDELTAAHKTLPLPTLARVTNLENGRSVVVRINDRGPFASGRIIDVTHRVAQMLDFEAQGIAKVRVQVLTDESKAIADANRRYGSSAPDQTAQPSVVVNSEALPPPQQTLAEVKPAPIVHQMPVSGANQIYVQAGSFTNIDNANRMVHDLAAAGKARIVDAVINGTKYYRVRLGPIRDVTSADDLLKKVSKTGVRGARIVVD